LLVLAGRGLERRTVAAGGGQRDAVGVGDLAPSHRRAVGSVAACHSIAGGHAVVLFLTVFFAIWWA
jgi:hypothetical protein